MHHHKLTTPWCGGATFLHNSVASLSTLYVIGFMQARFVPQDTTASYKDCRKMSYQINYRQHRSSVFSLIFFSLLPVQSGYLTVPPNGQQRHSQCKRIPSRASRGAASRYGEGGPWVKMAWQRSAGYPIQVSALFFVQCAHLSTLMKNLSNMWVVVPGSVFFSPL